MTSRGTIIVFSGALGLYTGALSTVVAEKLGWKSVRFSDYIKDTAIAAGKNPDDRKTLQEIGQQLVREKPAEFVEAVLRKGGWKSGERLIIDGLRHAEIHAELERQIGQNDDLRTIHIALNDPKIREDRTRRADGGSGADFAAYKADVTEAQLEESPEFADLILDGLRSRGELATEIIKFCVPGCKAAPLDDRDEAVSKMEPLIIEAPLQETVRKLIAEAAAFASEVPPGVRKPLADLVRAMNCYYSNRIEGHNASPREIALALGSDYEQDAQKRFWQAEARAHISVQKQIDDGGLLDQSPTTSASLRRIHDRFFSEFPKAEWISNPDTGEQACVIPGDFRKSDVKVREHKPPSPGAVPRFIARFEQVYAALTDPEQIIFQSASMHHRLLWIHPFADGNGRVARLVSDAVLSRTLKTHSLWSVSRGLALNDEKYKSHLRACDLGRRNDQDGRGNLSQETIVEFTKFFLQICIEQVDFMRQRLKLDAMQKHIDEWVDTCVAFDRTDKAASKLIRVVLERGAIGVVEGKKQLTEGTDKDQTIKYLTDAGVVKMRGEALTFGLPTHLVERFLPGLFPN